MSLKAFLMRELTQNLRIRSVLTHRSYATSSDSTKAESIDITSIDSDPKFAEEAAIDSENLEAIRNKSRLNPEHRNILNEHRPYKKPGIAFHHNTITFKRRMLGRYGIEGSGVPPGVAWPTKEVIAELKEYERVAYPQTIQESWASIAEKKKAEEEAIQAREDDITAKMAKTAQWEKELKAKLAKKEAEQRAAKERKERLVEEVRRHFGFKVDPRDEKFKEMIELKEKEEKKRRKAAKKQEKADKLMARLLELNPPGKEGSPSAPTNNQKKTEPPTDLA